MKKIILLLLFPIFGSSQTIQEFQDAASQYGNTFDSLENKINKKSSETEIDFGLENRVYNYPDFSIIAYELDDSKTLGEISFISKKGANDKESWYNICKALNQDQSYKIIDSFINSDNDNINLKKIAFNDIIGILRKSKDLSDYIYYIVYQKDDVYYQMSMVKNQALYKIIKNYKKLK